MKKKGLIYMILGLTAVCLAAGCSSQEENHKKETAELIQLEVWAWDDTFNVKAADLATEYYRKKYPDTEIKVVSKEKNEIMQKLSNDFSAGVYEDLPDVVLIEDYQIQDMLSRYGDEFEPLDDILDYSQFQDYKANLVSRDGIHYGVPFDSGAAVMFYRLDFIKAAGYTEEDMQDLTWDEYIEMGRRIKEANGVDMLTIQPDDLGLIRIMMQSGGSWYVEKDGRTADIVDNIPLQEAICTYQKLVESDLVQSVNGWEGFAAAFQKGRVATVVSGCWAASTIQENPEQKGLWRVAQIPRMDGVPGAVNASNIGGSSWYVLKNKEHREEAARFVKETFGENKDFLNQLVGEIRLIGTRKDAMQFPAYDMEDPYFGDSNVFKVFNKTTDEVPVVNYGSSTYEIEAILADELQAVMKGEELKEGLEKVQLKAQAIIG